MRYDGRRRPEFRRPAAGIVPTEQPDSRQQDLRLKTSGFWQGAYQGWFATALEQTKAVFTLASAGVGLSLTLLFGENVQPMESWAPIWLLLATVSFVVASCLGVAVFHVNKRLLGKLIRDEDSAADEAFVGRLDKAARHGFGAGLQFLILSGVSQVWL